MNLELAKIKEIYIYPIKSLSGIKINECYITKYGIAHPDNHELIDRRMMVVDSNGSFLTQRQLPRMALIKPSLSNGFFILSAPGKEDLFVPIQPSVNKIKCRVWDSDIYGYSYGGEVSVWLSEFLQKENLDLVNFGFDLEPRKIIELERRSNNARENDIAVYHDLSPLVIISENSLSDLNKRLETPVSIRSFRPNFFVSDCEPYAEDDWLNFKISNLKCRKIKHCTRCLLTSVDPDSGVKNPKLEPWKTLKKYRLNKELYGDIPIFGICAAFDNIDETVAVNHSIVSN